MEVHTSFASVKVLALCDSASSHSCISEDLATKLNVKGLPTKLTVQGINSQQVIDTRVVELKLTPVHWVGSCSTFNVKPYVRNNLHVGNDADRLDQQYLHLEPVAPSEYSYGHVEMNPTEKLLLLTSDYHWLGFCVDLCVPLRKLSPLASKLSRKVRVTPSWPINFGVGLKRSLCCNETSRLGLCFRCYSVKNFARNNIP